MQTKTPATWRLLDTASGDAAALLLRWRDEGKAYGRIAEDLHTTYGITVSREWVRLQVQRLVKAAA